ncbi:MAG: hypothetical protein LUF89_02160 [Ruminococcus sp.]|nr:hypothetical protein [Ruminococcus sp.]
MKLFKAKDPYEGIFEQCCGKIGSQGVFDIWKYEKLVAEVNKKLNKKLRIERIVMQSVIICSGVIGTIVAHNLGKK